MANFGHFCTRFSATSRTANKESIGTIAYFNIYISEPMLGISRTKAFSWIEDEGLPYRITTVELRGWIADTSGFHLLYTIDFD